MERDAEARKLLRESGFEVEDFPDYLKADPTLIGSSGIVALFVGNR